MSAPNPHRQIDRQLEKQVFLFSADEGVYGLWEFVQEVNHSFLTIAEKYAIAYDLLKELLIEELILLEKFTDNNLNQKIGNVDLQDVDAVLNQPSSWYPSGKPMYSVSITGKGIQQLERLNDIELDRLKSRLFSNR